MKLQFRVLFFVISFGAVLLLLRMYANSQIYAITFGLAQLAQMIYDNFRFNMTWYRLTLVALVLCWRLAESDIHHYHAISHVCGVITLVIQSHG
jgi:hypothetical protein